jgi:hypothetical protein
MQPVDAVARVGRKPTVAAGAGAAVADEAGRWDHGGTPSGTWEEHCQTELLRPTSSLRHCVADRIVCDDDVIDKL